MKLEVKIISFVALISFGFARFAYSEATLKYEPSVVELQGKLSLQEFPGPPEYESIARGDKPERFWILTLRSPVRVVADPDDELMQTQDDVKEIQLVCLSGCGERFSFFVGEAITLTGTLFTAHSGHHHKSVLMVVINKKE